MLRLFAFTAALFVAFSANNLSAASVASKLNWTTNFDEAQIKAKREKKSLLLFFTGSDWCGWCHKLENEALETNDFRDAIGDQFIFLVVDFPLKTPLDPNLTAQNKALQDKYAVKGFPTVVLLDENGQLIGSTGYRPGGGKAYADHLKKMVEDFRGYKQKISKIDPSKTDSKDLESLYGKACELCRKEDSYRIVKLGLQKKENHFFLLERYRQLADEGQIHEPEAKAIKIELLSKDSQNLQKLHYDIAVIEFEAYSKEMEKENYAAEIAVAPLAGYIEKYKDQDQDNIWQLYMIIAQVYLDKNMQKEALEAAKSSHAIAPESVQSDIQRFIVNIQK